MQFSIRNRVFCDILNIIPCALHRYRFTASVFLHELDPGGLFFPYRHFDEMFAPSLAHALQVAIVVTVLVRRRVVLPKFLSIR